MTVTSPPSPSLRKLVLKIPPGPCLGEEKKWFGGLESSQLRGGDGSKQDLAGGCRCGGNPPPVVSVLG